MNSRLHDLFAQSIDKQQILSKAVTRGRTVCKHTENDIEYIFRSSADFAGFSIKMEQVEFLRVNPPSGIAKMCDAILVIEHKGKSFVIAVEMKTNNRSDYRKQIKNGWRLCQWLIELLKDHGHFKRNVKYVGILLWQPNPGQLTKGATVRKEAIERSRHSPGIIYECKHTTEVWLHKFLR